ncbi:hypothetical protein RBH20_14470 [Haloarcula sp. H-GB4]|nr:hypothetical protein [Haloarcula sp. H-GB4]MDQ2073736.1 hypothetical protein [Haloarcula sp. H-GB4]
MCGGSTDADKTFVLPAASARMTDCTYCGCPVEAHDPVFLSDSPEGEPTAQFCNYGCLSAHIDEADLTTGTACEWSPTR